MTTYVTPDAAETRARSRVRIRPKRFGFGAAYSEPLIGIDIDPYVAAKGELHYDPGYGAKQTTTCRVKQVVVTQGALTPAAAVVGSDNRFLANPIYTNASTWWPTNGSASSYPRLTRSGSGDPVIDQNYSYNHRHKRYYRNAFTFNGAGFMRLKYDANSVNSQTRVTMMAVLVPHSGDAGVWTFYDAGNISAAKRFLIRYAQGHIQIYYGGSRILHYHCSLIAGEPIILGLSFDTTTGVGRMIIIDRHRTTRAFNLAGVDAIDVDGLIGISLNNAGNPDFTRPPDFDLLEFNLWLSALSFAQMENAANVLRAVYLP